MCLETAGSPRQLGTVVRTPETFHGHSQGSNLAPGQKMQTLEQSECPFGLNRLRLLEPWSLTNLLS